MAGVSLGRPNLLLLAPPHSSAQRPEIPLADGWRSGGAALAVRKPCIYLVLPGLNTVKLNTAVSFIFTGIAMGVTRATPFDGGQC